MYKLAAVAFLCALLLTLPRRRDLTARELVMAFFVTAFGFFGVITATFWLTSPAATAQTVSAAASGDLMYRIVQSRGAIVLPFGVVALLAAQHWPTRRLPAVVGPLAYNALMTFEALRAQFTPLATPERWLYIALHALWAVALTVYCLRLDRTAWRRPTGLAMVRLCVALTPAVLGLVLFTVPGVLIGAERTDPLLIHSAHAFGAALIALGAAGAVITLAGGDAETLWLGPAVMGLLALIWMMVGAWLIAGLALLWAAVHVGLSGRARA